jgi:hypothetical protein
LIFIPIILREELVDSSFPLRRKNLPSNPRDGLVAGGNKTCRVGFCVVLLIGR